MCEASLMASVTVLILLCAASGEGWRGKAAAGGRRLVESRGLCIGLSGQARPGNNGSRCTDSEASPCSSGQPQVRIPPAQHPHTPTRCRGPRRLPSPACCEDRQQSSESHRPRETFPVVTISAPEEGQTEEREKKREAGARPSNTGQLRLLFPS